MTPQQARDAYVYKKARNRYEHFKPTCSSLARVSLLEVVTTEIRWHPYAYNTSGDMPLVECLITTEINEIGERSGFWRSMAVDYLEMDVWGWDAVTVYIHKEYDHPMTFVPKGEELQRMFFCDNAIPIVTMLKRGYFDDKDR